MKVALYSPYLDTLGGGERYLATIAEGLTKKGDEVVIFWDNPKIIAQLSQRFHLDLSKVGTLPNIFFKKVNLVTKWSILRQYDFAIFLSDGSIPAPLAKNNILHFQVPFKLKNGRSFSNKIKLSFYKAVVANSQFTKLHIDKTYGISSQVIYPPVDLTFFKPAAPTGRPSNKASIILSVGRFSAIFGGKKQDFLIEVFKDLFRNHPDFELVLAGGVQDEKYLTKLQVKVGKLPIKIVTNISADSLQKLYGQAAIYWHAAGFGEDLERYPERAEHFGIAVVEAMAAACVPVVFAGGGLVEIVDNGKDGFLWKTKEELLAVTERLISNDKLLDGLAKKAQLKTEKFSKERFNADFAKIIN